MKIGQIQNTVNIPARTTNVVREKSEFDKMLELLEIGSGFNYTVSAKDKDTGLPKKPNIKAQYSRISSDKWAPLGMTFKVFEAEDQSEAGEFETTYTVARVDFVEPVRRAKRAVQAPAQTEAGEGEGEGHNGSDDE